MRNHEIHEIHEKKKRQKSYFFFLLSCASGVSWLKMMEQEKILYKEEGYKIQGAIFEVYREMGCGFLEAVYQECLERELAAQQIPFVAQQDLKLSYKGQPLQQIYKPDLVCYGKIIVELKAVMQLAPEHKAQLFNYLKASGLQLGLLVNFGHYPKVQIERIAL